MTVKFIPKMFIGLLSVFLIDLNTAGLKYYPFIFTIDKCNRSSNTIKKKMCAKKLIFGIFLNMLVKMAVI